MEDIVQDTKNLIDLKKTLIIVNPVAQSGKGSKNGYKTFEILRTQYKQDIDLFYTKHSGHAEQITAETGSNYDSVIVVGGDGVVHEAACGIMQLPKRKRPILGVVPVGSGNDYARSLGISFNVKRAIDQIMHSEISSVDVGQCNDKYFFETLSFGLDAGIALDTMKARETSKEKGFKLYFKCGINRIVNQFYTFKFDAVLDRGKKIKGDSLIFAVQIGKTYGGGFKITPDAELDDGKFNLCYTVGAINRRIALPLFAKASKGKHVGSKYVACTTTKNLKITLYKNVPCQMDGEEYSNKKFDIKTLHNALKVYKFSDNLD